MTGYHAFQCCQSSTPGISCHRAATHPLKPSMLCAAGIQLVVEDVALDKHITLLQVASAASHAAAKTPDAGPDSVALALHISSLQVSAESHPAGLAHVAL